MNTLKLGEPEPVGWHIIVTPMIPAPRLGGTDLVAAGTAFDKYQAQLGLVRFVGPETKQVKVGDIVVHNLGAGLDISHLYDMAGERLLLMAENAVLTKIKQRVVELPPA